MALRKENEAGSGVSRRQFLEKSTRLGAGVAALPFIQTSRTAPAGEIRVGIVGCGGRGTGAALNILRAETKVIYPPPRNGWHTEDAVPGARAQAQNVRVIALADAFRDRLDHCRAQLRQVGAEVPERNCFVGFDACHQLLSLGEVNYVILATPPHFRPAELKAAIEAGKHVFMEKPVAVDAPGVRSIIETGEKAKRMNLGIAAGTQRRHQADFVEAVRRLRDGGIGEIIQARIYFNVGEIWMIPREPGWSDMEWYLRNWNYHTWLSGDIIVEQHIHMIDHINWILGSPPVRAYGMGGRLSHRDDDPEFGYTYDHFAIEYEYPGGVRVFSQNRQISGCTNRVDTALLGTRGTSNGKDKIEGDHRWGFQGTFTNPYEQEHLNLIESIRAGNPINEARNVAESTLTAMMGREAAYTGDVIEWDAMLRSARKLGPDRYEFGDLPIPAVVMPSNYEFS